MGRVARLSLVLPTLVVLGLSFLIPTPARAVVTREMVERAIRDGVHFLKEKQRADGSWTDADGEAHTGTTSLVTLALLTAGEPANSPKVSQAIDFLRNFDPNQLK